VDHRHSPAALEGGRPVITLTHSVLSTPYINIPIKATGTNGQPVNPTGDTVQMAFMLTGNPGPSDWHAASWDTWTYPTLQYVAKCLIGPNSSVSLAVGTYTVWVKVTDNPEVPVLPAATLIIN
jgi:hypothetical protein